MQQLAVLPRPAVEVVLDALPSVLPNGKLYLNEVEQGIHVFVYVVGGARLTTVVALRESGWQPDHLLALGLCTQPGWGGFRFRSDPQLLCSRACPMLKGTFLPFVRL